MMKLFTLATLTLCSLVWIVLYFPFLDLVLNVIGITQTALSTLEMLHYLLYPLLFGLAGLFWNEPKYLLLVCLSSWILTMIALGGAL